MSRHESSRRSRPSQGREDSTGPRAYYVHSCDPKLEADADRTHLTGLQIEGDSVRNYT